MSFSQIHLQKLGMATVGYEDTLEDFNSNTWILNPIIKMTRIREIWVVAYLDDLLIMAESKKKALEKVK
ncbi:hypothetical protein C1646_752364 [Rhizophagus diaphanus]|nr:hypothetical protein C1646_752364 [Rhizophagus diaphanus] [Rhizophagus sp. MUCL 43196]